MPTTLLDDAEDVLSLGGHWGETLPSRIWLVARPRDLTIELERSVPQVCGRDLGAIRVSGRDPDAFTPRRATNRGCSQDGLDDSLREAVVLVREAALTVLPTFDRWMARNASLDDVKGAFDELVGAIAELQKTWVVSQQALQPEDVQPQERLAALANELNGDDVVDLAGTTLPPVHVGGRLRRSGFTRVHDTRGSQKLIPESAYVTDDMFDRLRESLIHRLSSLHVYLAFLSHRALHGKV